MDTTSSIFQAWTTAVSSNFRLLKCLAPFALCISIPSFASFDAGMDAWNAGNLTQAQIEFQNAINADPSSVQASVLLALTQCALLPTDPNIINETFRLGYDGNPSPNNPSQSDFDERIEKLDTAKWSFQANGGFENGDALKSGLSRFSWGSILSAEIQGPGTLSFWWKLSDPSAPREQDFLSYITNSSAIGIFHVNGQSPYWINEINTPVSQSIYLGPGTHQIQWEFNDSDNSDQTLAALWLDQVTFSADLTNPLPLNPNSLQDGIDLGLNMTNEGLTGRPIHSNVSGGEFQSFLRQTLIPHFEEIESHLALYDNPANPVYIPLDLTLTWLDHFQSREYRFDQADALYLRAFIHLFIGYVLVFDPHDLSDLPLLDFFQRYQGNWDTTEIALQKFNSLLSRRPGSVPDAAVLPLDSARTLMRQADQLARLRAFDTQHLYVFRPTDDSNDLFSSVQDADLYIPPNTSVRDYQETSTSGYTFQLYPFFNDSIDIRSLFPSFSANEIILGGSTNHQTFPDPSFNGILLNSSDLAITEDLAYGSSIWTFENWKNYPGNSNSLIDYLLPSGQFPITSRYSDSKFSLYLSASPRPAVSDYQWEPQFSSDLLNWSNNSGSNHYYQFSNYGTRVNLSYSNNLPTPPNIFIRINAYEQKWPADLAGWKLSVPFGYFAFKKPTEFRFKENSTVEVFDLNSGSVKGVYPVHYSGHGKSIHIHFFTENQIENAIELNIASSPYPQSNTYSVSGYGYYRRMQNPQDLNESTLWNNIENNNLHRFSTEVGFDYSHIDFENKLIQVDYVY